MRNTEKKLKKMKNFSSAKFDGLLTSLLMNNNKVMTPRDHFEAECAANKNKKE